MINIKLNCSTKTTKTYSVFLGFLLQMLKGKSKKYNLALDPKFLVKFKGLQKNRFLV